tara:strand:+ start:155 stop:511 length:357 start_codon:yes stop_codon:yes gene_type:complete
MLNGKIQKKYLCMYPDCNKRYVSSDGLRKHCKKKHMKWLEGKKTQDYEYMISAEYEGDDYVMDYMSMVRAILAGQNMSTNESTPNEVPFLQPTPHLIPNVDLNIPIEFYTSLFCDENI